MPKVNYKRVVMISIWFWTEDAAYEYGQREFKTSTRDPLYYVKIYAMWQYHRGKKKYCVVRKCTKKDIEYGRAFVKNFVKNVPVSCLTQIRYPE